MEDLTRNMKISYHWVFQQMIHQTKKAQSPEINPIEGLWEELKTRNQKKTEFWPVLTD